MLSQETRQHSGGPAATVLARSRCRYLYVPYQGLPAAERRNRLQLELQVWAPFEDCAAALVETPQGCMVFAWDATALAEATRGAAPTLPTLPETLLRPRLADGVALQACVEGFEGQVWQQQVLLASRWWPQRPDAAAWLNFQRGASVQSPLPLPEPAAQAPALDVPWAWPSTPQGWREAQRLRWHAGVGAVALLLLLPTLWLGLGWWQTRARTEALQLQAAQIEPALQPVLRVRSDALQGLAALESTSQLLDRVAPLDLLAHLSRQLPADGAVLRQLEWEGKRLRLVLAMPARASRTAYVKALEEGGWLRGVREEAQEAEPGTLALVAELATATAAGAPASGAAR